MHLEIYAPEYKGDLKGLIQICHGMTEYMGRYVEFAKYFTSRGYIVFGNDIISHGHSTTPRSSCLYINDWNDTVKDGISKGICCPEIPKPAYLSFGIFSGFLHCKDKR